MLRVFVDTSIVRFSETERQHWIVENQSVQWGPTTVASPVHQPVSEFPLEKLNHEQSQKAYRDALLIPKIDDLAKDGLISLCWHKETQWEYLRKRTVGSAKPSIIDRIGNANCQIYYGRLITSPFKNEDEQLSFLQRLNHSEFEKWKKIVGGAKLGAPGERSQLMDAWNLWSADHNHCDYFLTMDYKLIKSVASRKHSSTLRLVSPSIFLAEFQTLRVAAEAERAAWQKIRKPPDESQTGETGYFARFKSIVGFSKPQNIA